jgi:hypothetical protein
MQKVILPADVMATEHRKQYWGALHDVRHEYIEVHKGIYDLTVRPTFHYWLEEKYGLRMGLDGEGNYTQQYDVVDPKRFMLFQIKYFK